MAASRIARSALAAILLPVAAYTVWLAVSRQFFTPAGVLDWAALALSLAIGVPFVWRLPWGTPPRGRAVLVYVALGMLALSFYTWVFLGLFYGQW